MKNVPKLRFKEFNDEWDKKSFNTCFEMLQNNTLSRDKLTYTINNCKNIHYGDILTILHNNVDTSNSSIPYIINDEATLNKIKEESYLKTGDIVFADTAEDYTAGKCIEIINDKNIKVVAGLHTFPCRSKFKFSYGFLGQYLNSNQFHNQMIPYLTGIKVYSINKKNIKKLNLTYPSSLKEQEKIASFLSAIDKKIELQEKKIEVIGKYKNRLLNLFFKDNTDYQHKLGSYIRTTRGSAFPLKYQGNMIEKYPFFKVSDMNHIDNNVYMNVTNHTISENTKNILKCNIFKEGTTIFPIVGAALLTNKRRLISYDCCCDNNIIGISTKDSSKLLNKYLFYFMQTVDFKLFANNGVLPSINKNIIDNLIIPIKKIEEQEKIASFLSLIDKKLEVSKKQLELYKKYKKGLLQQMFV